MKPDLTIIAGAPDAADAGPGPSADGGMNSDLCVPLDALSEPDEQDQMQEPAEGDSITMQVEAKITKIVGKQAYIQPTAVNGKALDGSDADPDDDQTNEPDGDPDDIDSLQQTAQQMDASANGGPEEEQQ